MGYMLIETVVIIYLIMVLFTVYSLVNNIFRWRNWRYSISFETDKLPVIEEHRRFKIAYHTVMVNPDAKWVVLFHSWGRNASRLVLQSEIYLEEGYNLLLVDAPGHGRSKWVANITAINWANATTKICEYHDIKPSIVHGLSFGSITTLLFIQNHKVDGIVLEALPRDYELLYDGFFHVTRMPRKLLFWVPQLILKLRDMTPYDPKKTLADVNCPMFLLHGSSDKLLPIDLHFTPNLGDLYSKTVTSWSVPKASHSRLAEHPEYEERLKSFLKTL
jgi:pimeloyl-ACP methyl ester carboxylesterase